MSNSCRSRVHNMRVRQPNTYVFRFPYTARACCRRRYFAVRNRFFSDDVTLVFCLFYYTSFRRDYCNISNETSTGTRSLTLLHRSARSLDAPCRYYIRGRFYGVYWIFITMFPVAPSLRDR